MRMRWILFLILFVSIAWGGRPRIPQPKTPDEVHQNDQDLIDKIENLSSRTIGTPGDLIIASGIINVTRHFHSIDTESASATDNLDTINGGSIGDTVVLQAENSARTVVVKDGAGNLDLAGDFSMDNVSDKIILIRVSISTWNEISRSGNGS